MPDNFKPSGHNHFAVVNGIKSIVAKIATII